MPDAKQNTYRGSKGELHIIAEMPTNYLRNAVSSMQRFAGDVKRWPDPVEYETMLADLLGELMRREAGENAAGDRRDAKP